MFNNQAVDIAMSNLHVAINDALAQVSDKIQESASWTVDELNNETQRVLQEGGYNLSLAQIFEAGACFAAERILASITTAAPEGTPAAQASPGMVSG